MVTKVPPADGPVAGLTALTVGAATYVNWSAELVGETPPGVVTVTFTVPEPAGLVAVIEVDEVTLTAVAGLAPKVTVEPVVKPVPVMVTTVLPAAGPVDGLTALTVGAP